MTEAQENYRYAESGLNNITLANVTVRRCSRCGNQTVVIPSVAGLHRAIAFGLVQHAARLSKDEVRFLRKYLGYSQEDFAEIMGVTVTTVSKWENGADQIGVQSDKLLRMFVIRDRPVEEYPNERLAKVACDGAAPAPWLSLRLDKGAWQGDAAVSAA